MSDVHNGCLCFDPVAHEYDWSRFLPPDVQEQAALLLQQSAALKPGQVFLDAGTGTGRFAVPLARQGVSVLGIDISPKMLAALRAKIPSPDTRLRVAQGDLRALPLRSQSVGAALLVHILHLIQDWKRVLEEVKRVLEPEGTVFLASEAGRKVPTRDYYFALAYQKGLLREHVGARSREEIQIFLRSTGATVERIDGEQIRWVRPWQVGEVLEMVRRRTWSSLWAIPDSIHAEMVAETEAWARKVYGTLDTVEEAEATLDIYAARWPGSEERIE